MTYRKQKSKIFHGLGIIGALAAGVGYIYFNTHIAIIQPTGHKASYNVFWLPNHQDGKLMGPDFTVQFCSEWAGS